MTVASMLVSGCAGPADAPSRPAIGRTIDWAMMQLVRSMPTEALAGQLIMIGVENHADGRPVLALDDASRRLLADLQPGAALLFGRNFASPDQVIALVGGLHAPVAIPPFVAVDYEGGLVSRLTDTGGIPATRIPSAAIVGRAVAAGSIEQARELGRVMGRELRSLGVTMNFAPVADVDPPEGVGAIGRHQRTFGRDPELVGRVAATVAAGLHDEGVAAVVKHFPGHGRATEDSHDELPVIDATLDELLERDLLAFRLALQANPAGIMTAHLALPGITGDRAPATVSAPITRIARTSLGFDGLIVTDALNMRALSRTAPEPELVVRAVAAGADMLLMPRDPLGARDAIVAAAEAGRLEREGIEASVVRIVTAKQRIGLLGAFASALADTPARAPVGSVEDALVVLGAEAHRALVDSVRAAATEGQQ